MSGYILGNKKVESIDFFGSSMKMPFNISSKYHGGKCEIVEGVDNMIQILSYIFYLRKWTMPMRRRKGFDSSSIIFRPILSSLRSQIEYYLKDAVASFGETRLSIESLDIDFTKSKGSNLWINVSTKNLLTGEVKDIPLLWEYGR